ncbi:unnamed protein product [Tilletia controversa]|uniref:Phenolic acid decarboxylase n=3 Tax=Tilletia TaxID=13289 RepID=A0A8X7SXM8_9BASI|nr:hypothetical protein CF336_g3051 [Tilletia laevis]KAE8200888.1 hypothetical protein CF328_g2834 [Tilletia controversa]KAE8262276.1 hypothetical protein A4X03_0g2581 [Tilletia caries]KAE8205623.1 hypothetical protein CF335_g2236 [Tilletia laevis]KAE8248693.1 hypothetical protein A4X06_0g3569 [Tilletia controversa]
MSLDAIINKHVVYEYDNGWRYEAWYKSADRIVYKIHSGPMGGRSNWQECSMRKIRDDIFMISWIEETGTVVTTTVDLGEKRVHSYINFSRGHWEHPEIAHGHYNKQAWRELAKVDPSKGETLTTGRKIVTESATIVEIYEGKGDLEDIDPLAPTL